MITKRNQYQQTSIQMTESEAYDLLMEQAHEQGYEAVQYIENKLKVMAAGVNNLGVKGAAMIILNANAKGYWPPKEQTDE